MRSCVSLMNECLYIKVLCTTKGLIFFYFNVMANNKKNTENKSQAPHGGGGEEEGKEEGSSLTSPLALDGPAPCTL